MYAIPVGSTAACLVTFFPAFWFFLFYLVRARCRYLGSLYAPPHLSVGRTTFSAACGSSYRCVLVPVYSIHTLPSTTVYLGRSACRLALPLVTRFMPLRCTLYWLLRLFCARFTPATHYSLHAHGYCGLPAWFYLPLPDAIAAPRIPRGIISRYQPTHYTTLFCILQVTHRAVHAHCAYSCSLRVFTLLVARGYTTLPLRVLHAAAPAHRAAGCLATLRAPTGLIAVPSVVLREDVVLPHHHTAGYLSACHTALPLSSRSC